MSTHPRLETRVNVLERRQILLEALIEELSEDVTAGFNQVDVRVRGLSEDMAASFKQLADYQIQTEHQIDTRFNQVDARLDKIEATMATKEDLATLEKRILETTKSDMTAMENHILDAFKQLIAAVNPQRPPSE